MEVIKDNIWRFRPYSYIIVPTNGMVRNDGACVMGRGLALQAKQQHPKLPFQLGQKLENTGNHVYQFHEYLIITFPVKHKWFKKADLKLIEQSCIELRELMNHIPVGAGYAQSRLWKWTIELERCSPYIKKVFG